MSVDNSKNFYCSQKFTWLSVDLEKHLSHSCCSADSKKLDVKWLKNNPGNIFNTPELQQDRIDMLENRPVPSCSSACWIPESKGLASRRIKMKTYEPIDREIDTINPTDLNFMIGSTCNLTCSYCCKQYSSAWYRDIAEQGSYVDYENRYTLILQDHIVRKISHVELEESDAFQTILNEASNLKQVKRVAISGGEPFLYNKFPDLLNNLDRSCSIAFYTGLGVNSKRLKNQVQRINNRENIEVVVSAENCGKFYEFNRYGISFDDFLANLQIIIDAGFRVKFNSVLSNLTLFGIVEFAEKFKNYPIVYSFCNSPNFLSVNVLDDASKLMLINSFKDFSLPEFKLLITSIQQPYSNEQKYQFSKFVTEFAKRRNLQLDIFPDSMLKWLEI